MPTELDQTLDVIVNAITAEGQPFETVPFARNGVEMPAFKGAPPTMAHLIAHFCTQSEHKDAVFLVDGDLRMTFAEVFAAATCVAEGLGTKHGVERLSAV